MTPGVVYRVVASSVVFAIAGSSSAQSPPPAIALENRLQFSTGAFNSFGDASEHMRRMRERLQDPQQRAVLREEHRGYIVESHYDVAEALELDAATYDKLIDLLTDQQMEQLDQFHVRGFTRVNPSEMADHLQSQAERETRKLEGLREVLGARKLEQYQVYALTLTERRQVREYEAYLKTTDKLRPTQKEQLIELFRAHNRHAIENHHALRQSRSLGTIMREMPSQEEMQRRSQLMTIESNENSWRQMPKSDRRLREQAAAFLTAPQLAALEQLHAAKLKQQQQMIEQMRLQAGLSPDIPAEGEVAEPTPAKANRDVRVRIKIAVNKAKPATFTEVVSSGTTFTFEVDEGLLVQATPTLYDDDTFHLRVEYFEQGATGKRQIGSMGSMGMISKAPRSAEPPMGGSGLVISGSKAYAIELSSSVEAT